MVEISIVLIVILFFSTMFIYICIFNICILYMDVCLKLNIIIIIIIKDVTRSCASDTVNVTFMVGH